MPQPSASDTGGSRSATVVIFTAVFLDLIGFGIVLPLLPGYAARHAVSDQSIGFLVASFSLMQFLLAPWWGRVSDRIGRRPVLLTGLAGSALSYLLFAFATNFRTLLISRVIAGGMGATVTVAQAYLADITPAERRSRAMGLIGAAFGLGFVVGPALGGVSSRWGDCGPGLVAAALTAGNFVLAWFRLPETRVHQPFATASVPTHWRRLAAPFAVVSFSTIAFTVMYVVFPLYVERNLHYDRDHTAYLFVLIGLITALVQGGLVGRLAPRFGEIRLMLVGCAVLAIGLTALPLSFDAFIPVPWRLPAFLGSILCVALGPGLAGPSASAYVSRVAPAEEQGRALGTLLSFGAVARILGPMMAGAISQQANARAAFLVSAGAAVVAGLASGFTEKM